ncbi:hypothetical protein L9F63_023807 [Diploptera punctata]|uniref:Uncharacterized protein n=1 Tax=Diploptera punctata TaxID=6984 RepID=A0AAD8E8C7_DIPPU|nr:hypothetical protein L9F63_023807 [Diploptera punctata]
MIENNKVGFVTTEQFNEDKYSRRLKFKSSSKPKLQILGIHITPDLTLCNNANITCRTLPSQSFVRWTLSGRNITDDERIIKYSYCTKDGDLNVCTLHIDCVSVNDIGNYTCHASAAVDSFDDYETEVEQTVYLNLTVTAEIISTKSSRVGLQNKTDLSCIIQGYPLDRFDWKKDDIFLEKPIIDVNRINDTLVESKLSLGPVTRKDNGTYHCIAYGPQGEVSKAVPLFVLDTPLVQIDFVKAVGARRIYLNWTVNDGNEPVQEYFIQHMKNGTGELVYYPEKIGGGNTSYVIRNLDPSTAYELRLTAKKCSWYW